MKLVFIVPEGKKAEAERLLKADDTISRGSITLKSAESLDIDEKGYFIILDIPEDSEKKAEEVMKDLGRKYKDKEKVLKKIMEQEDSAVAGFGKILG